MLSKLQSRLTQLSQFSPSLTPSTQAPSKPRLAGLATSQTIKPQSTALRTLRGDSVFEPPPLSPRPSVGDILAGAGPAGDISPVGPQRLAVEKALASRGAPVPFVNTDGQTEEVTVRPVPYGEGDSYQVRVGDDVFTVTFEEGSTVDREAALAQIIDSFSETPPELRGSLDKVEVKAEPSPSGALAEAYGGTITFYDDGNNLNADVFHHELGHLVGGHLENQGDSPLENAGEVLTGEERGNPVPEGWEEAAAADGNHLNSYTEESHEESGNYNEDFAEAWSEYMRAIDGGPVALALFEAKYPARAELLEEIYPPPA